MSLPTSRAFVLWTASTVVLVAGFAFTPLAAVGLALDALVLALVWRDGRAAQRWPLTVRRTLPSPLFQDELTELTWTVQNEGTRPLVAELREVLAPALSAEPVRLALLVAAQARQRVRAPITPRHRGPVSVPPAVLRVRGPLGLAWRAREVVEAEEGRVLPKVHLGGQAALILQRALRRQGSTRARRYQGLATEPAGVREYQPGDPYRLMHWKASARYGRPVTRELDFAQHQHLVLLLDCGRPMAGLAGTMSKLDHAISAVIALLRVVLAQGDAATVVLFSDQVRRIVRVDKRSGGVQGALLAMHAEQADRGEPDYASVVALVARQVPRRSVALLVTSVVDLHTADRVVDALTGLAKRHRPVLVDLVDPGLAALLSAEPETAREAYAFVSAIGLEQANESLQVRLRARGVRSLSTPAAGLAAGMLSTWLALRSRRG